jgi:hypothetical protein
MAGRREGGGVHRARRGSRFREDVMTIPGDRYHMSVPDATTLCDLRASGGSATGSPARMACGALRGSATR